MHSSLIFFREGLGCFLQPSNMLKVSKITDQPEVIQMNQEGPFLLAESQENDYQF